MLLQLFTAKGMNPSVKDGLEILLSLGTFVVVLFGAISAYLRFGREGTHAPRIEFSVDGQFLGPQQGMYLATFTVTANNKGHVEHKFEEIRLRARGIKASQPLHMWQGHEPRAEFPEALFRDANLIPTDYGYYFVRPGINQTFNYNALISEEIRFIVVRATFKYSDTKEIHTAEKTLEVKAST